MNYQGFGDSYQGDGGGGGFVSPGFNSPGVGTDKKTRSQSLLPITAAMIGKADYNTVQDVFTFNGHEINQVTFVGVIREVQEAATNISFKIDDMTGEYISVRKWLDDEEKSDFKRSECREDTYVRVIGSMKALSEGHSRNVMAYSICPVTDFNEITYHFLDVVYAQLSLEKGAVNNGDISMQTPGAYSNQQMSDYGAVNDAGLSGTNKVVFTHITACVAEQGISIHELRAKTRNLNEQQLRNAIDWLSNEGHIYSTIDDDHYRSTSS